MATTQSFTYSGDPATDMKDAVRLLLADTNSDSKGWMLADEEILWTIANEGNRYLAAAQCCEILASLPAGQRREVSEKRIGDLLVRYGTGRQIQGTSGWHLVARQLRRRASRAAMPAAGGIDTIDRQDREEETMVQPAFTKGMSDDTSGFPF